MKAASNINRSGLVVRPKQPFFDWAMCIVDGLPYRAADDLTKATDQRPGLAVPAVDTPGACLLERSHEAASVQAPTGHHVFSSPHGCFLTYFTTKS